jgi:hypothetical protein
VKTYLKIWADVSKKGNSDKKLAAKAAKEAVKSFNDKET